MTPQNGSFALVTLASSPGPSDPLVGQALGIVLESAGLQADWDDVRLNAVPEPGSLLLGAGLGAVALVVWSRERRKPVL